MNRLLLAALLASTLGAKAQISTERAVSTPEYAAASFSQSAPKAASDGDDFLVLWADGRPFTGVSSRSFTYGTRVTGNGAVVDDTNLRYPQIYMSAAALEWGRDSYILVSAGGFGVLNVTRIGRDGAILKGPEAVATDALWPFFLARGRDSLLLLWRASNPDRLVAQFLDLDGRPTTRVDVTLPAISQYQLVRALTTVDGKFELVYTAWTAVPGCTRGCLQDLREVIVAPTGLADDRLIAKVPAESYRFDATEGPDGVQLVSWIYDVDNVQYVDYVIRKQRTETVDIRRASSDPLAGSGSSGSVANGWDGRQFAITFTSPKTPYTAQLVARRVTSDGFLIDSTSLPIAPAVFSDFSIRRNGSSNMITWTTATPFDTRYASDVVSKLVRSFDELAAKDTLLLSRSAASQSDLRIVDGNSPFAVWREFDVRPRIMAAFLGRTAIEIAGRTEHERRNPAAAYGDGSYLIAWRESVGQSLQIFARRMSALGLPLEAEPILVAEESVSEAYAHAEAAGALDVGWGDGKFVVAWEGTDRQIHAKRIASSGTPLDATPIIVSRNPDKWARVRPAVRVLWSGSAFVVIWTEDRTTGIIEPFLDPPRMFLLSARLSSDGSLLDDVSQLVSDNSIGDYGFGAVRDSDGRIAVGWMNGTEAEWGRPCLFFHRFDPAQVTVGGTPTVCYGGTNGSTEFSFGPDRNGYAIAVAHDGDIQVQRLNHDGDPISGAIYAARSAEDEVAPVLASSDNRLLIAYSRTTIADPLYNGPARLFWRELETTSRRRAASR